MQPRKTNSRGGQRKITDFMPNRLPTNNPILASKIVNAIDVPCFQLNNQKRIISCETLNKYCEAEKHFLGQEPSLYNGRITGLNTFHTLIHGRVDRPRAYIFAHRSLRVWPMETFVMDFSSLSTHLLLKITDRTVQSSS